MKLKKLISAIAALTIVFSVTPCGEKENGTEADDYLKTMTIYNGAEIDIVNEKLRQYIDAVGESEQAAALESGDGLLLDTQILTIEWESDGSESYFIERLKAVYAPTSGNVNEATVNYLKTVCGVTESQINTIKSIMLTK